MTSALIRAQGRVLVYAWSCHFLPGWLPLSRLMREKSAQLVVTGPWSCLAAVKYQKRAKGQLMERVLRLSFSSLLLMSQMFIRFDGSTRWHCVREQRSFTVRQKKGCEHGDTPSAEDSAESISRQQMQIHLMRAGCQGTESKRSFSIKAIEFPSMEIGLRYVILSSKRFSVSLLCFACTCLTWQSLKWKKKKQQLTTLRMYFHSHVSEIHPSLISTLLDCFYAVFW